MFLKLTNKKMNRYTLPYNKEQIEQLDNKYGTPFLIFDEKWIKENVRRLYDAFSWVPNFKNYYAVKAHPNPYIMDVLKSEGCGMDCSSLGELLLAEATDIVWENIMFSSNNTPIKDFQKAKELWAIINFDDINHISFYQKNIGKLPELVCCRYNPGGSKMWGNDIIGIPIEAKYGFTTEQIIEWYRILKKAGVKRFGLHTMVMSNDLHKNSLIETAELLLNLLVKIEEEVGIEFEFINLGWGIWIPYHPEDEGVDVYYVAEWIKKIYEELIHNYKRKQPLNIVMEQWRNVVWPYAELVSKVRHMKHIYKDYIGLDSSMSDFMRPWVYGAYHHITVLWKENEADDHLYDVTGSLCENNDKFAINRQLPEVSIWDYLALHYAGAHGNAMGFNYNAKLKCKELLIKESWDIEQIKRAETLDDYFAIIDYKPLTKILEKMK